MKSNFLKKLGAAVALLCLLAATGFPLPLALGHQALAFMLAGATIAWLADITPRRDA